MNLAVNEIFTGIQHGGAWDGLPAVFLRLQGCNLSCEWCQRTSTIGLSGAVVQTIPWILDQLDRIPLSTVVVVGGEPALQIDSLIALVIADTDVHRWHIVTNGTIGFPHRMFDWITVNAQPEEYLINPGLYNVMHEVRFTVVDGGVLTAITKFIEQYPRNRELPQIFIQPCNDDPKLVAQCVRWLLDTSASSLTEGNVRLSLSSIRR